MVEAAALHLVLWDWGLVCRRLRTFGISRKGCCWVVSLSLCVGIVGLVEVLGRVEVEHVVGIGTF